MAKSTYLGISGTAHKVKRIYTGIDGKARKVKKGYIGVNGVARQFYSGNTKYFGTILQKQSSSTSQAFNQRELKTGALIGTVAIPVTPITSGPLLCADRYWLCKGRVPNAAAKVQAVTLEPDTFVILSTFESLYNNYNFPTRSLVGGASAIVGGMSGRAYYIEKTDTLTGAHIGSMGQYYYSRTEAQPVTQSTFTFASRTYNSNDGDYNFVSSEWDFNTGTLIRNNFKFYVTYADSPRNIFGTLDNIIYTYFSYWNSGWYTWDYSTLAKLSEIVFSRDVNYSYEGHIVHN